VLALKMRLLKLTPEFLMERLQGKSGNLTSNLPSDVELLDIKYDLFTGQVLAVVRSDSFEDLAETYPIPEFVVTYSTSSKTVPSLTTTKAEVKPTVATSAFRSESVPVKKVQPKRNANLMEEEFSMEQRKLLSFTVEGNYVVVKPVKFLKAEWDDINEVVRSVGGRWVKGDIISYWEIPLP
jgi:hypothetical protein